MKLNTAASARFFSYTFGLLIQISIIFLMTTKLEIYQFGLWGVSMSFVFILSTLSQMTFFQNIEKYFPNYSSEKRQHYFIKYLKTIFCSSPLILIFLYTLKFFNYFDKFYIDNVFYLLIMLTFLSTIESCLVISDGYFVATRKSNIFDLFELSFYKVPRFFAFYILLNFGFSVFYLIFFTIVLRFLLLLLILKYEFKNYKLFLKVFQNNSILKDNFQNIRYNFVAFFNNSLYISFINILFLISSNLLENIDIAHYALMVLVLNNLRPIMNTIPSLLPPLISRSIETDFKLNSKIKLIEVINQILISSFLLLVLLIVNFNNLISIFFEDYFDGIYKLIFLASFASTLNSIYFTKYLEQLFNKQEVKILKFNCVNYITCLIIFYILFKYIYLINFIYIFIFYELLFFIFINYLSNKNHRGELSSNYYDFTFTYLLTLSIIVLFILKNIFNLYFYFLIPFSLIFDFIKTKKYLTLKN